MKNSFQCRLLAATLALLLIGGCSGKQAPTAQFATIAVEGDVDSFNPLFAEEQVSVNINDLIFPRLVNPEFDTTKGELIHEPLLARSWEFSADGHEITFHLRSDARWSDGVPVTAKDVQFSFRLYGDTAVGSVRASIVQGLRKTAGKLDVEKAITIRDDSTVVFLFERQSPSQLFDVGVPLIPHHVFSKIPTKDLRTHSVNKAPITCGPFALGSWQPMQEIVLVPSTGMGNPYKAKLAKLIFKILPEPSTRVRQLESGEVDAVAGLGMEDAKLLEQIPHLRVNSLVGRDYDFIGWNNIDPVVYAQSKGSKVVPHPLFGSRNVRRALTMAINRKEIVSAYLGEYGMEAIGGISPLFKWAYNDTLTPLPHNVAAARALLEQEGWKDSDGDGVRENRGRKFSFILRIAAGNQLRSTIATVIQEQLKEAGIDMRIEQVERATFWNSLIARKYDAWFAGFSVPLQMQLDDLWGSNLRRYLFNLAGYQNPRVDQILMAVRQLPKETDGAPYWKEFQVLIHHDQPYTFMFWIHNIVAVNRRLQNTHIGALGVTHKAWEWSVSQ